MLNYMIPKLQSSSTQPANVQCAWTKQDQKWRVKSDCGTRHIWAHWHKRQSILLNPAKYPRESQGDVWSACNYLIWTFWFCTKRKSFSSSSSCNGPVQRLRTWDFRVRCCNQPTEQILLKLAVLRLFESSSFKTLKNPWILHQILHIRPK